MSVPPSSTEHSSFNPPGPPAPPGWSAPQGSAPDPSWPPPEPWQLWTGDPDAGVPESTAPGMPTLGAAARDTDPSDGTTSPAAATSRAAAWPAPGYEAVESGPADTVSDFRAAPGGPGQSAGRRKRALIVAAIVAFMVAAGAGGFALALSLAGHGQIAPQSSSPAARLSLPSGTEPPPPPPTPAPSLTPTSTPSTSAPTGTTVSVAAVTANPAAPQVQTLLVRYFTAINEHGYSQYSSVLDQQMQQDNPSSSFAAGYATTRDSAETVTGISDTGGGDLAVRVTFTSRQDPADSPDNSSCTDWAITLYVVPQDGNYLIGSPPSSYSPSYHAC